MRSELVQNITVGAFIVACAASVAAGITLAIMHSNAAWLLLCLPIVLFLS